MQQTQRLVILGFGSIGSGLLPLLLNHFPAENITIIGGDNRNINISAKYGVAHVICAITQQNYQTELARYLQAGYMLVNLSVNVSSEALVEWCESKDVLYLDTCIEPWEGYYTNTKISPERRSNYSLRQDILDMRRTWQHMGKPLGPTAIMAHGANPGLVNHFVKRALLHVADKVQLKLAQLPQTKLEWSQLAQKLGLRTIHMAERDTQRPRTPKQRDEFVNTWSIDGFVSEGLQPSEMSWGTHEKHFPQDGNRFSWGCKTAIWLNRTGCVTQCRSWTPNEGEYRGWIITHNESISIGDYFSDHYYRPTVHYAYHPCDSAVLSIHEMAGKNFQQQTLQRLIVDEVVDGMDELGVLLMGTVNGDHYAYWYGSQLDIDTARSLAPYNNATSLQVVAPVLAGILFAIDNPTLGIVEADDLPHEQILQITDPYMGKMTGSWTDWTPLKDRGRLFAEDVDTSDPWQFKNFRVV